MNHQGWIEAYARAWRQKDDEAVGELFTEDAIYRSSPFREPTVGREAIREYWRQATADQQEFELQLGEPVVQGNRAVVEWWATMLEPSWAAAEDAQSAEITLPGCLLLRFDSEGLCEELREYWHVQFGNTMQPPPGWGE